MSLAIGLVNPKFVENVGQIIRAAACFDVDKIFYTGNRLDLSTQLRIPRTFRHKDYRNVDLKKVERVCQPGFTPVAVEYSDGTECLFDFEHPENAQYIFGPEDGSLNRATLVNCHRFVKIPTKYCMNIAAAVNVILYDRRKKESEIV